LLKTSNDESLIIAQAADQLDLSPPKRYCTTSPMECLSHSFSSASVV
jgi:hypothetical protein